VVSVQEFGEGVGECLGGTAAEQVERGGPLLRGEDVNTVAAGVPVARVLAVHALDEVIPGRQEGGDGGGVLAEHGGEMVALQDLSQGEPAGDGAQYHLVEILEGGQQPRERLDGEV